MKVMVTGASGLLGTALYNQAPANAQLLRCARPDHAAGLIPLDITDTAAVQTLINQEMPDVIIHAAAEGSLDWCEEHPDEAQRINTTATAHLAAAARAVAAYLIFISSNAVYGGKHGYHHESEPVAPANVYGRTKADAEKIVLTANPSWLVIRPNMMFGFPPAGGRDNQVSRVFTALSASQPLNVVSDTYFSPIAAAVVAYIIWQCASLRPAGTLNVGSAERVTLYELSRHTAVIFDLDQSLLTPITVSDTAAPAPRAIDTSFDISRLQTLFGPPPTIDEQLAILHQQLAEPVHDQNTHP